MKPALEAIGEIVQARRPNGRRRREAGARFSALSAAYRGHVICCNSKIPPKIVTAELAEIARN